MDGILYFISNLVAAFGNLSFEGAVTPIIAFLIVAIYWRETGHFAVIGWLVRIVWIPINIVFVFIWIFSIILSLIADMIRGVKLLKFLVFCGIVFLGYWNYYFIPLSVFIFYMVWFGIDTEGVKKYIFFYPQAKRIPAPKIKSPKPLKPPKAAKLFERKEKEKEAEKPPLVKIVVPTNRGFENENAIIGKLEPHLQALISKST
jgi:hypothetical protein